MISVKTKASMFVPSYYPIDQVTTCSITYDVKNDKKDFFLCVATPTCVEEEIKIVDIPCDSYYYFFKSMDEEELQERYVKYLLRFKKSRRVVKLLVLLYNLFTINKNE
jgi:hypothetical protein